MTVLYLLVLGSVPLVLTGWALRDWKRTSPLERLVFAGVTLLAAAPGSLAYFLMVKNIYLGVLYYAAVLACCGALIAYMEGTVKSRLLPSAPLALLALLVLLAIPFSSLEPGYRLPGPRNSSERESGTQGLTQSLVRIRRALDRVEEQVTRETRNVDVLTNEMNIEVRRKNKELRKVKMDLEHYRRVAMLSKEQADSVVHMLNRGKYTEYLIGIILGVISSAIVWALQIFFERAREARPSRRSRLH